MKSLVLLIALIAGQSALAATPRNPIAIVSQNPELTALITAAEKNRDIKCEPITEQNLLLGKHGAAEANLYCNTFDKDGNPQANVTFIKFKGVISGSNFDLSSVRIAQVE